MLDLICSFKYLIQPRLVQIRILNSYLKSRNAHFWQFLLFKYELKKKWKKNPLKHTCCIPTTTLLCMQHDAAFWTMTKKDQM